MKHSVRVQRGQWKLLKPLAPLLFAAPETWRPWQTRTWTVYGLLRRHLHEKSHLLPLWEGVPGPDPWHAHPKRQAWLPGVSGLFFNALPLWTLFFCWGENRGMLTLKPACERTQFGFVTSTVRLSKLAQVDMHSSALPSLVAWRSSETLGEFPAAQPMWKPAGGSSHSVRLPKSLMGREGPSVASLACVCTCVYVCVSLRLWLGSLSPITKWPVFTFQCGWGKVTAAFGQKQLLFTEMPINYSQYVSVNISASQCSRPVHYTSLTHAIDLQ